MLDAQTYRALADAVLVLHLGIVVFVVGGLVAIVAGNLAGWRAVDGLGFRLAHLLAIAIVVAEAWTGLACPLTSLEMTLRTRGRDLTYTEGFIEHWLQPLQEPGRYHRTSFTVTDGERIGLSLRNTTIGM